MSDSAVVVAPRTISNALFTALDDEIAVVDTGRAGRLAGVQGVATEALAQRTCVVDQIS
jgi:hypothetical protein